MALSVQLAESTSKSKFGVFLSYNRGESDSVKNFASSLYAALWRKGIITFKGEEAIIEDCRFAIVVLSQDFAASTRCLDEIQEIVESRKELDQEVFPIFYDVDPSDVRDQKGSFENDFAKLERRFIENKDKVQRWRRALRQVGNLSGWNSTNWHESDLIENIASETLTNISSKLPSYHNNLVGIPSRMAKLNSYLGIGLNDVRFVGIYGVGGIGKTTLARLVYEQISSQFEICCFLGNVSEKASKKGQVHLQRKLLSHISSMKTFSTNEGKVLIKRLFCNKKVLLVLDNVDDTSQLENLGESPEWFGAGSRVIITTRDMQLLKSHGVHGMYKIETMNEDESLQLLSKKAFRKDEPDEEGYLKLSKSMVQYGRGIPLALDVLGCFLCGRSISEWEDTLEKMKQIPETEHNSILQTLQISYDGLDLEEKSMFLIIARFFKGWEKNTVIHLLEGSGLYSNMEIGLSHLIEKSLLIEKDNCLDMHDLLDELAMSIISQESSNNNAEQRNRLREIEEINHIFERNEEIRKLTVSSDWGRLGCGIQLLGMVNTMNLSHSENLIETPNFSEVPNLEFLILEGCTSLLEVHPPFGELELRACFSLKILPTKLEMDSLVELVLRGCSQVTKLPEFGECMKNLVLLDLQDTAITQLPESLRLLTGLRELNLEGCKQLVCLPFRTFHDLKHLRTVKIFGGLELILPENLSDNASESLDVGETCIVEVLPSTNTLSIYGLWRIVGVVSSICGVVTYGLSSSFKLIFGEWNLLKMFLYCVTSFIVCGMMLFPSTSQVARNFFGEKLVVLVMFVLTTIYSFLNDKFVSGKPDVLSLISTASFALMRLSLSRQTRLGFDVGMSYFFIGFLMLQLMKIRLILVTVAVVVCYFFIYVHSSSDSHLQLPVTGTARIQECAINIPNEAETRDLGDIQNTQKIVNLKEH